MRSLSLSLLSLMALLSHASVIQRDFSPGPTINFANATGPTKRLASGILYGLPDNQTQIPSDLLSGFGFNYARAAGAQVGNGWCWSPDDFKLRFASALSNYQLTRKFHAPFVLMLHDLWGFDSTQNSTAAAPGDNGDWSNYDAFLEAVIALIKANDMQTGLVIDLWNEPDNYPFWPRSQEQWLTMWGRGYYKVKGSFPKNTMRVSGPSTAGQPSLNADWWTNWAAYVKRNNSIPDQYVWHEEVGTSSSMTTSYAGLVDVLQKSRLPLRTVNINEYAVFDEQVPAGSGFWISQLERYNAIGLRGNWLGGTQLHDLAASLLSKPDPNDYSSTGYFPNGDWQVYHYYAKNMTGTRYGTSVSPDGAFDAFATVSDGYAKILFGVRPPTTGAYTVTIKGLSALGLPPAGSIAVRGRRFAVGDDAHYSAMGPPQDLGSIDHSYSDDTLTLPYWQDDQVTTYSWEFAVGK